MPKALDQINQDMETLCQQMSHARTVIDSLSSVQTQFLDFAQTYHSLQDWLKANQLSDGSLSEFEQEVNDRFNLLQDELNRLRQPVEALISSSENRAEDNSALSLDQMTQGLRYRIDQLEQLVFQQRNSLETIADNIVRLNYIAIVSLGIAVLALGLPIVTNVLSFSIVSESTDTLVNQLGHLD